MPPNLSPASASSSILCSHPGSGAAPLPPHRVGCSSFFHLLSQRQTGEMGCSGTDAVHKGRFSVNVKNSAFLRPSRRSPSHLFVDPRVALRSEHGAPSPPLPSPHPSRTQAPAMAIGEFAPSVVLYMASLREFPPHRSLAPLLRHIRSRRRRAGGREEDGGGWRRGQVELSVGGGHGGGGVATSIAVCRGTNTKSYVHVGISMTIQEPF